MTIASRLTVLCLLSMSILLGACASSPVGGEAVVGAVPFAPGERLEYALHNLAGAEVGRGTLSVGVAEGAGLLLGQEFRETGTPPAAALGMPSSRDITAVSVDVRTLQPHSVERDVDGAQPFNIGATYAADGSSVTLTRDLQQRGGAVRLGPNAYANESALWLWRTLPLAEEYEQRYVSVDATEGAVSLVTVTVKARERVEVPAGAFDTWRVLVRDGRATGVAWINVDAPHQVVQWDNGALVFRLTAAR